MCSLRRVSNVCDDFTLTFIVFTNLPALKLYLIAQYKVRIWGMVLVVNLATNLSLFNQHRKLRWISHCISCYIMPCYAWSQKCAFLLLYQWSVISSTDRMTVIMYYIASLVSWCNINYYSNNLFSNQSCELTASKVNYHKRERKTKKIQGHASFHVIPLNP